MNLQKQIKTHIKHHGFLTIAQYMKLALDNYYAKNDPLGKEGDFITAPEISQIFGELIGMWLASNWAEMGSPDDTILVELGAGRGTLLNDFLRATAKVPNFHTSINIHIVEINETLREQQKQLLEPYNIPIFWHDDIKSLPHKPILLVANEFFDALPIHQFIKRPDGWRERTVTMNQKQELVFGITEQSTPQCAFAPKDYQALNDDALYEFCPQANVIIEALSKHIATHNGAALVIDYGYWNSAFKNTLQALKSHAYHNPLDDVGEADITAHVNFKHLANTALSAGAKAHLGVTQGQFLETMGIHVRATMLQKNSSKSIDKDVERLIGADQMGELFKCLAVTHRSLPTPYAFENDV